jgi:AraC-like DNA-binding protein
MHKLIAQPAQVGFAGAVHGLRDSMRHSIASLGWLDYVARPGATNANLPSDLFLVSLRCSDTAAGREMLGTRLHVMITPVRERPRQYQTIGRNQIAVASLTPLGMLSVFRTELRQVVDRLVPLDELCGAARARQLWTALQSCYSADACCEAFGRWLEAVALAGPALASADQRIARTALRLGGMDLTHFDLSDLAAQEGVTRRQLERDFRRRLAVSPGAYARLVRFQRAAAAVARGMPLLDAALDNGYADQAHMNRAFKTYTGLTPRALAQEGSRPGRELLRQGLAGRVFLLDLPPASVLAPAIQTPPGSAYLVANVQELGPPPVPQWAA